MEQRLSFEQFRLQRGLSKADMCQELQIPMKRLIRLEKAWPNVNMTFLVKLKVHFNIDIAYLPPASFYIIDNDSSQVARTA